MAKTLTLPFDQIASIAALTADAFGDTMPGLPDQSVASDNAAVSAQLSNGEVMLAATSRTGSATITLSNAGGLTPDTVLVTIGPAKATANFLDVGNVTFAANPSPPTA